MTAQKSTDSTGAFRLMAVFIRAYPARTALMIGCLFLANLTEGFGIAMFLPLIDGVLLEGDAARTGVGRAVQSALQAVGMEPTLTSLLILIVVGMWVKGGFLYLAMRQIGYSVARIATDLRLSLIAAITRAEWRFFTGHPVGMFANSIGLEARTASNAYQSLALVLSIGLQLLLYFAMAILVSWRMALLAVCAGGIVTLVAKGMIATNRDAGERQTALMKSLASRMVDALHGIKQVKAMGREQRLLTMIEAETQGLEQAQRLQVSSGRGMEVIQEPMTTLIMAVVLFVALTVLHEPVSALIMQGFLFQRILGLSHVLLRYYQAISNTQFAFWSIRGVIDQAEKERETLNAGGREVELNDAIRFDKVSFAYERDNVLEDVSFRIPAGKFVALSGASGCGKTTLSDLVAGLFKPSSGTVYVDEIPLDEIDLHAWRRRIGYVSQETYLSHDTIHHNVTMGEDWISREAVEAVLRDVEAWDFVSQLPQGIDTVVGERGSKLSGGQRQRIAIARALAGKPRLLILDEVTTALDPETEKAICKTLGSLHADITVLAISHQQAMIDVADIVFHVANGGVAERPAAPSAAPHQ